MLHPRLPILVAVASIAMVAFQASAASVAESKAVLSQLSYQVKDLDTSDGIPASLVFNLSPYEGTALNLYSLDVQGNVLDPQPSQVVAGSVFANTSKALTSTSLNGSAAKDGSTLTAKVAFSTTEAAALLNAQYDPATQPGDSYLRYQRTADVAAAGSSGGLSGLTFTLAAHSSVVFSGQVDLQSSVSLSALLNSPAYAKAVANQASIYVGASANLDFTLQTPFSNTPDSPADGPQYFLFGTNTGLILDPLGNQFQEFDLQPVKTSFTLTFSNTSDQAVTKVLNYAVTSNVTMGVMSVPENSTLVMQAFGLMLLGGAVRIRQRRS